MTNRFQPIKSIRGDTIKAEDLRASILQAAVQGRLVPQDPNDEPAEELVKRIRAEKQRLIREGKIKKERNVSEIHRRDGHWYETIDGKDERCIDDEIPFEIPDSWTWCRVSSLVSLIQYGYTASASINGNAILLRITDIQNNSVDWSSVPHCLIPEQDIDKYRLDKNNILIARTGGTVGKSFIIDDSPINTIFASYLIRLVFLNPFCIKYVDIYLKSSLYWYQLADRKQGTGQPNVNSKALGLLLMPVPPYSEQERIVNKIDSLNPLIERYGQIESEYSSLIESIPGDLRASILQAAVQGMLVPQDPNDEPAEELVKRINAERQRLIREGKIKKERSVSEIYRRDGHWYETIDGKDERCIDDEIPFEIPDSWMLVRLGSIFNIRSAMRIHKSDWTSEGVPFYRGRELVKLSKEEHVVSEIYISESLYNELKNRGGVPSINDILISAVGTIGKTFVVKDSNPFYYKDAYILCFENYGKLNPILFKMFLDSHFLQVQIHKDSMATTVSQLTLQNAKRLLCPVPPIEEQKRVVEKIDSIIPLIERYGKVISQFNTIPYDSKPKEDTE